MKKKNQWLPAFVLATALLGFPAMQMPKRKQPDPKFGNKPWKKQNNGPFPKLSPVTSDLKDKIAAKQKVAGYDTKPYEQRLARLEEELKKAKAEQK